MEPMGTHKFQRAAFAELRVHDARAASNATTTTSTTITAARNVELKSTHGPALPNAHD